MDLIHTKYCGLSHPKSITDFSYHGHLQRTDRTQAVPCSSRLNNVPSKHDTLSVVCRAKIKTISLPLEHDRFYHEGMFIKIQYENDTLAIFNHYNAGIKS